MFIEADYYFGETLRWNLFWTSPNMAGAFLAVLIPLLWPWSQWCVERKGWRRGVGILSVGIEAALWLTLCMTFSRGALVAVGVALMVFTILRLGWATSSWAREIGFQAGRVALVAVLLLATGFLQRIEPGYVSGDASAGNRLVVWEGGVQAIAAAPWTGWGSKQSGRVFMEWFQPLDREEGYLSLVNSYLTFAAEFGLPWFVLVLALLLLPWCWLLLSLRRPRSESVDGAVSGSSAFQAALASSLAAFFATHVFTNLWVIPSLWIAPLAVMVVAMGISLYAGGLRLVVPSAVMAVTLACLAAVGLWAAGVALSEPSMRVRKNGDTVELHLNANGSNSAQIGIRPDRNVLGRYPGREIRRLATDLDTPVVISVWERKPSVVDTDSVIWLGPSVDDYPGALTVPLLWVHPEGVPPGAFPDNTTLLLPGIDLTGTGRAWRRAGLQQEIPIETIAGVGHDITPRWPEAVSTSVQNLILQSHETHR